MSGGKQVAILSTMRADDDAYSICNVINDQLGMLLDHGYAPKLLVTKGYQRSRRSLDPRVMICELSDQPRYNEPTVDSTFTADVEKLEKELTEHLQDVDVVLTHDIIYQPDALKHNVALRAVADKNPRLRFMHWIHSATSPDLLISQRPHFPELYKQVMAKPCPRSYYIFFNNWSIPRLAKEYQIAEDLVKIVHHPTDYMTFAKFSEYARELCTQKRLLEQDYVMTYPARLDNGKQLHCGLKLMASLKRLGFTVHFVAVDFHSSSDDPQDPKFMYRQWLKGVAAEWGLTEEEYTFTSERLGSKVSVPGGVIHDLMSVSNVFFMSSSSESYSLVTQEAAMSGNLIICNRNFPPFRELWGPECLFFPAMSNVDIVNYRDGETRVDYPPGGEALDYLLLAKEVVANTINKQNQLKRRLLATRNPDYIFTRELEPLITSIQDLC